MGNSVTTMFGEPVTYRAWWLMISDVAFKTLIGATTPTRSILKWITSSRWPTGMPKWFIYKRLPFNFKLKMTASPFLRRILNMRWRRTAPDTVMTPEMEKKYWKKSAKDRAALQRLDARFVGEKCGRGTRVPADLPPLVVYYTPALPPLKQEKATRKSGGSFYVSAKNYCKWHRMVFPDKKHPTVAEAARLRNEHDPDELKEIYLISRMLPDNEVFPRAGVQQKPLSSKYQKRWKKWLDSRPGGEIVFEETSSDEPIITNDTRKQGTRRSKKSIPHLKLNAFGSLRAGGLDGGYDVKATLPILIDALQ